jgi:hypothetical protein
MTEAQLHQTRLEKLTDPVAIDYAGGIVGIVTSFATAGGYIYTALVKPNDTSAILVISGILAVVLTFGIAILSLSYSKKVRKIRRLEEAKNAAIRAYDKALNDQASAAKNLNVIFSEFARGVARADTHRTVNLNTFANHVQAMMDRYSSSGQSAVCIKLINNEHQIPQFKGPYLWTAARDDLSSLQRSKTDDQPQLKR